MEAVEYKNKIYTKCQMLNIAALVPLFFLQKALTYFHLLTFSTSPVLAVFAWFRSWVVFVSFSTGGQQELSGRPYNWEELSE